MQLELFHVKENRILLLSLVIALFLGLTESGGVDATNTAITLPNLTDQLSGFVG